MCKYTSPDPLRHPRRAQDRCSDYRARITGHVTTLTIRATLHHHTFLSTGGAEAGCYLYLHTRALRTTEDYLYTILFVVTGGGGGKGVPASCHGHRAEYGSLLTNAPTNATDRIAWGGHNFVHIHTAGRGNPRLYTLDTYTDTHSLSLRRSIALD